MKTNINVNNRPELITFLKEVYEQVSSILQDPSHLRNEILSTYGEDEEIMFLFLMSSCTKMMSEIGENLRKNKDFAIKIINAYAENWISNKEYTCCIRRVFEHLHPDILKDKEVALLGFKTWVINTENHKATFHFENVFNCLDESLRSDIEIAKKAIDVSCSPKDIEGMTNELKGNKELATYAIHKKASLIEAFTELQADEEIVLLAIKSSGEQGDKRELILNFLSKETRKNRRLVIEAIRSNSNNFTKVFGDTMNQRVMDNFKEDKGVIIEFLKSWGKDNRNVISMSYHPFEKFEPSIKEDRDIVMELVKVYRQGLKLVDKKFTMDREIVTEAVKNCGSSIEFAPEFQMDREIVTEAVKNCGSSIEFAPEFQADKNICLIAVRSKDCALKLIADEMKKDRDVIKEAISNNENSIMHIHPEVLKELAKNFIADELKKDGDIIKKISSDYEGCTIHIHPKTFKEFVKKSYL